jgi:hypothetical protein
MSERHQSSNLFRAWKTLPAFPSATLPKKPWKAISGWQTMGSGRLGAMADTLLMKTVSGEPVTPRPTTGMGLGRAEARAWSIVWPRGPRRQLKQPRAP